MSAQDIDNAVEVARVLMTASDTTPTPAAAPTNGGGGPEPELIERLLDAQQDINLAANETMSQPLADASALIDEIEPILRRALLGQPQPCRYCGPGVLTGLPGNACENCMNTGLDNPLALQPQPTQQGGAEDPADKDLRERLAGYKWSGVSSTMFRLTKSQADRLAAALNPSEARG